MVESVDDKLLVHELQLGDKLNESVHSARRADFSFLLAMLTDDVQSHSQFSLPQTVNKTYTINDDVLRKELELPDKAPLALNDKHSVSSFNQAELIGDNRLNELHLLNALRPNPLGFRDNKHHIQTDVMNNTSLFCQTKYQTSQQTKTPDELINKRLNFDAKGWLNTVQESMVQHTAIQA